MKLIKSFDREGKLESIIKLKSVEAIEIEDAVVPTMVFHLSGGVVHIALNHQYTTPGHIEFGGEKYTQSVEDARRLADVLAKLIV